MRKRVKYKTTSNIVYGLIDPRTRLIFYIGLSSRGLKRPREHRHTARGSEFNCQKLVKDLQKEGLIYEITVLEELQNASDLPTVERWWIAYGKCSGWPLTNCTKGGEFHQSVFKGPLWRLSLRTGESYDESSLRTARLFNYYRVLHKNFDVDSALTAARCRLSTTEFEQFKALILKHHLTILADLPPRLACPCGHIENFHDEASLLRAVHMMSSHLQAMALHRKSNTKLDHLLSWFAASD
jgi:hypothetical protein